VQLLFYSREAANKYLQKIGKPNSWVDEVFELHEQESA
jgi:hypothetical protein